MDLGFRCADQGGSSAKELGGACGPHLRVNSHPREGTPRPASLARQEGLRGWVPKFLSAAGHFWAEYRVGGSAAVRGSCPVLTLRGCMGHREDEGLGAVEGGQLS